MFVEFVSGARRDWETVRDKSRVLEDPPDGLLACIALPKGDDEMSTVMVWESADVRGTWAAEVMMPLFEAGEFADVASNPSPIQPIDVYIKRQVGTHAPHLERPE